MRVLLALALALLAAPAAAQSTAQPVVPGFLTTTGCPSGQTVCFKTGPGYSPSGVTTVTGSFNGSSPSSTFTPIAGRPFNITLAGTLPASLALKCSVDGGSNYLPIVVENVQMYAPTLVGLWEYQTAVSGTICRFEWTGTAVGTYGFYQ